MHPGEIYLAKFPFGDAPGMKIRPVLLLTGPVGAVPEIVVAYISSTLRLGHRPVNSGIPFNEPEDVLGAPPAQARHYPLLQSGALSRRRRQPHLE